VIFLIAMNTKDERTLREVTLPNEDFDWLLKGDKQSDEAIEKFKSSINEDQIHVLQPGDELTLPGNQKMTIKPEEVTKDRVLLLPPGAPLPMACVRQDGHWLVDASPLIAARKSHAAREQEKP